MVKMLPTFVTMGSCITNSPIFIGSCKFCVKSDFHKYIQKLHEFHVMVNMNNIYMYSIFEIFKHIKKYF